MSINPTYFKPSRQKTSKDTLKKTKTKKQNKNKNKTTQTNTYTHARRDTYKN